MISWKPKRVKEQNGKKGKRAKRQKGKRGSKANGQGNQKKLEIKGTRRLDQGQTKSKLAEILKMESSIHAGLAENSKAQWFSENVKTGCCESFSPCTLLYAWQTWWFYSAEIQSSPCQCRSRCQIRQLVNMCIRTAMSPNPHPAKKQPPPQLSKEIIHKTTCQ